HMRKAARVMAVKASAASDSSGRRFLARLHGAFHPRSAGGASTSAADSSGGANSAPIAALAIGSASRTAASITVDRKSIDKCTTYMTKVMKLCRQPQLNLKNSPPYLPDTIPDTAEYINSIVSKYNENYQNLSENDYFPLFIHTLISRCKQTVRLFKEAKERMFDETSEYRQQLTKLSLTAAFSDVHPIHDRMELVALKSTIDLTCNDHVSVFEFDVFVRLFQPWRNILQNWKRLAVTHPGYMAFLTYDEVRTRLMKHIGRPGAYIYRQSCTKLGQWAIGYVTDDGQILQTIIQNKSLARALIDGARDMFYLYPDGNGVNPDLSSLVQDLPPVVIQVTQQQYEMYCSTQNITYQSFQLCKICMERDKEVRIEPCGHYMCAQCIASIQASQDEALCPFCRREIKGTESVILKPFMPPTEPMVPAAAQPQPPPPPPPPPPVQAPSPPPRPPRTGNSPASARRCPTVTAAGAASGAAAATATTGGAAAAVSTARENGASDYNNADSEDERRSASGVGDGGGDANGSFTYATLHFDPSSSASQSVSSSRAASPLPARLAAGTAEAVGEAGAAAGADQEQSVQALLALGYTEAEARQALSASLGSLQIARNILAAFTLRQESYVNVYGRST
uniref:E3 ubiquitin-protein ligase CBL n=1 Tax=Macrostomum lignano TaxID=282301 RepID=A0A1I8J1G3_9PLAT